MTKTKKEGVKDERLVVDVLQNPFFIWLDLEPLYVYF